MKETPLGLTGNSALDFYTTAYQYQYEKNNLKEACRLYREIIRHFPDSNESAYAVVQLEKIGAQEALTSLQGGSLQKILPYAAVLLSLFALIIAGIALLLVLEKNHNSMYNQQERHLVLMIDRSEDQSAIKSAS